MELDVNDRKDLRLLDLRGLAPLDAEVAAGDPDLLAVIGEHNARSARATARLRQLIEDRRRLRDFDSWQDRDGEDLLAEHTRLRQAAWETLREIRQTLKDRQAILEQLGHRLGERYGVAHREYDREVEAAKNRLAKERRLLERANPATANSHFADLVAEDPSVQQAAEREAAMRCAFESVAESCRNITADLRAATIQQREVFKEIIAE